MLRIVVILCSVLVLGSCNLTYRVLLGVDSTPKWYSQDEIKSQARKHGIPEGQVLILDTATYEAELIENFKSEFKSLEIKNFDSSAYNLHLDVLNDDLQPVQFRLFDNHGYEVFKIVNCYVDPPIPMNWNVDGCFDVFPPKIDQEALNIHKFELPFLLSHTTRTDLSKMTKNDLPDANYYGVIFWNEFFKRPSKRLLKTIEKYVENADQSIHLIYVNNHNQQIWSSISEETKKELSEQLAR